MSEQIDLSQYEWAIKVRPLSIDDFDALVAMQAKCFPGMTIWKREQIESQLQHFPQGQLVVEVDGKLAASSSSLIVSYDPALEWHNWMKMADGGYIRNHEPKGDTLYGIEIMVDPEFRGMKLSRRLYDARKQLCRDRNLSRMIIGGRIPGYGAHADEMTAREYVDCVVDKSLHAPVLTAQIANGFALQGLIPEYFPTDHASLGYATFCEWINLEYQSKTARRKERVVDRVRLSVVQYEMR